MYRMAFRWWITARRRWRRRARLPADGHIHSWGLLRSVAECLLLVLRLRLYRCRRGRRRVIKLNRWGRRGGHWGRRNVIRRGGIGEGRGVLVPTTALDITGAAELWSHKSSTFIFLYTKIVFIILIILIWEAHLNNILALKPIRFHYTFDISNLRENSVY